MSDLRLESPDTVLWWEIFEGANFRGMAREALRRNVPDCNIHVSMPRNHTHHILCTCNIYRCVGVSPSFNFRVDCSALEK